MFSVSKVQMLMHFKDVFYTQFRFLLENTRGLFFRNSFLFSEIEWIN